ncbi:MAG: hypothetical protein KC656_20930 [Myxococcales bacterium]|nr:hypothetical protein [Myxococcales bacterium]
MSAAMAVAETRGYVRMRCHVGEQYESTGDLDIDRPLVRNGWFHASSPDLEGTLAFEIPYDDGQTNGRAHGFTVRWRAETPGSEVPCEVIWPRFAEVTLELTVDGRLVDHDIVALGCVEEVTGHSHGRLTGMVLADVPCFVQLQGMVDEHAAAALPSLPEHGQLTVRLEVGERRLPEDEPPEAPRERTSTWSIVAHKAANVEAIEATLPKVGPEERRHLEGLLAKEREKHAQALELATMMEPDGAP